jgi:hypothetical protein
VLNQPSCRQGGCGEEGILSSSSEEESESEDEDQGSDSKKPCISSNRYVIPKHRPYGPWSDDELDNFRKNWPHLRNFSDSVLRHASLSELTGMARQKVSSSKVFAQVLSANYDQILQFPVKVEAGEDNCTGQVHSSRFLRGYVGDSQELWVQARKHLGPDGLDPIGNYEVVSLGIGDLITPKTWGEIHKPNSRQLSIRMLSQRSVDDSWRLSDKDETPKEFVSLHEFKMAMSSLDIAIRKVMPWNMAFATLHNFLISNNFGEDELEERGAKLTHLANFVDEILRANARNWEERKVFLSHQDICVKWTAAAARRVGSTGENGKGGALSKKKENQGGGQNNKKKLAKAPGNLCRRFNEGRCESKEENHPASWDSNFLLKHACSKYLGDKKRFCLEPHAACNHK